MSLAYYNHQRTRYLRDHAEIYQFRKNCIRLEVELIKEKEQRQAALEKKQEKRRCELNEIIKASRFINQENDALIRLESRLEAMREREKNEIEKIEQNERIKQENLKWKNTLETRYKLRNRLAKNSEERIASSQREIEFNKIEMDRRNKERESNLRAIQKRSQELSSEIDKYRNRARCSVESNINLGDTRDTNSLLPDRANSLSLIQKVE